MLSDKLILYDDSCSMCSLYTKAFVQCKMLEPQNRMGFSEVRPELAVYLDIQRSRHEIPLLDTNTGEVSYGIDALFLILGHHFPIVKPLFRWNLFRKAVYSLYQLITYNRRVIAGTCAPRCGFDCAPDFNLKYRVIYLVGAMSVWLAVMSGLVFLAARMGNALLMGMLGVVLTVQVMGLAFQLFRRRTWDAVSNFATNLLVFALISASALVIGNSVITVGLIIELASIVAAMDYGRRFRNLAFG